jgi:hypothetical protein
MWCIFLFLVFTVLSPMAYGLWNIYTASAGHVFNYLMSCFFQMYWAPMPCGQNLVRRQSPCYPCTQWHNVLLFIIVFKSTVLPVPSGHLWPCTLCDLRSRWPCTQCPNLLIFIFKTIWSLSFLMSIWYVYVAHAGHVLNDLCPGTRKEFP